MSNVKVSRPVGGFIRMEPSPIPTATVYKYTKDGPEKRVRVTFTSRAEMRRWTNNIKNIQ